MSKIKDAVEKMIESSQTMGPTRRTAIKLLAYTGVTAYGLGSNFLLMDRLPIGIDVDEERDFPEADFKKRRYHQWRMENTMWGMVIDLAKCDGCVDLTSQGRPPRCTSACQTGHYAPTQGYGFDEGGTWQNPKDPQMVHEYIKVFKVQDNPWSEPYFFPRPCQQCLDPPCVHVCPVQAAWQRSGDRLTLVDQERCIGCRLCMAGCPYEVRFFHWEENPNFEGKTENDQIVKDFQMQMPFSIVKQKGVIAKCDFCGNQFLGKLPHCVASCHKGALYFGNLLENAVTNNHGETLLVDETIAKRKGFRWKEEEGTRPRVFYLPANTK